MPDGSVKSKTEALKTNLKFKYMPGFGNDFETEALAGALPQGMNLSLIHGALFQCGRLIFSNLLRCFTEGCIL